MKGVTKERGVFLVLGLVVLVGSLFIGVYIDSNSVYAEDSSQHSIFLPFVSKDAGFEGTPTPPPTRSIVYKVYGLDFGPYTEEGQNPEYGTVIGEGQIRELLTVIAPYTRWVRTFGSTHGLENMGRIGHEYGLKVAAGAWLGRDLDANEEQISSLIEIAGAGEADVLVVGSEVLLRGDLTESQLIDYINQVKQASPETPVTTADVYDVLLAHPAVIDAVDVVFVNYYPCWVGVDVENAVAWVHQKHQQVVEASQGKPIVVSETGWPSDGTQRGDAVPSTKNAAFYFLNFVSWARASDVDYFYFEAFDEPWKSEDSWGPHWGVWDSDRNMKPGLQAVFDGETMEDNWSGEDIPGGPGDPAIEFTYVPPYGE
ncbi:MAG: glycosyl hydrolase family 17 protein [Patescibacteria group bacterium]